MFFSNVICTTFEYAWPFLSSFSFILLLSLFFLVVKKAEQASSSWAEEEAEADLLAAFSLPSFLFTLHLNYFVFLPGFKSPIKILVLSWHSRCCKLFVLENWAMESPARILADLFPRNGKHFLSWSILYLNWYIWIVFITGGGRDRFYYPCFSGNFFDRTFKKFCFYLRWYDERSRDYQSCYGIFQTFSFFGRFLK